jgi:MOSC domain-containing protein YiiM
VSGVVVAISAGKKVAVPHARLGTTAIDKRPISGPVEIGPLGPAGDEHADPVNHGGLYQAVYAYAQEDAEFWEAELERQLWLGAFGENLSTRGVDASGAVSGERWHVGTTVLQVTTPRIPCTIFAGFWDVPDLIKRFTRAARPGAYLRVLEPGVITAGDRIDVLDRPPHGVTVSELARARAGDRSLLPRIREVTGLPPKWHEWVASVDGVKARG